MNIQDFKLGVMVLDQNGKLGYILIGDRFNGLLDSSEQRVFMVLLGSFQFELVIIFLIKGFKGFGFVIVDSLIGQKVKMILDSQWC